jgi:pyruvate dehydrogenase E1 component
VPSRRVHVGPLATPQGDLREFHAGVNRDVSTTMVFVQILRKLLKDATIGRASCRSCPTRRAPSAWSRSSASHGIYSSPASSTSRSTPACCLFYQEAKDGQILEEGITEAGSMASFTAAGTAYATTAIDMIPFFIFYSMFGFQRIGDLIWAFGDQRGRGFLLGATSGRTTLNGEGLQHEDGHSHVLASTVPNCVAYDPAFHYELAVIIQDGLRRMYASARTSSTTSPSTTRTTCSRRCRRASRGDPARALPLPALTARRFLGAARVRRSSAAAAAARGGARPGAARRPLGRGADVWSATSYKQLRRDALACERWNLLHPDAEPRVPYVTSALAEARGRSSRSPTT